MQQILIADADVSTAHLIEASLRAKNYQCQVLTDGLSALEVVARQPPSALIMAVALPGLSGLELCRRLKTGAHPLHLPVLLLSASTKIEDRLAGLEAGADDFLTKPFEMRELELRLAALLRRVSANRQAPEPNELRVGELRLDKRTFKAFVNGREAQLTPVEFDLLWYLMRRAGEVVSADRLLRDVWQYYPGTGDAAVVRVQIMNLRDKLERDRRRPKYIQTVYRHGYLLAA